MNFKSSRTEKSKKQFFCKKQKTKKKQRKTAQVPRRCFPVNFAKSVKTVILQNICERLLRCSMKKAVLKNFDASLLAYY